MKKVAIFGNAGAGKSTLARRLATLTRLSLHTLDIVQFPDGGRGAKMSPDEYAKLHAELLRHDEWIIDGFDNAALAWERFAAADTLVYIDLPLLTHYWWVSKRLIKGLFANPLGWPDNTPVWESSMQAYQVIGLCHRGLTPRYRKLVADTTTSKRVHHLRSRVEIAAFIQAVEREYAAN